MPRSFACGEGADEHGAHLSQLLRARYGGRRRRRHWLLPGALAARPVIGKTLGQVLGRTRGRPA